MKEIIKKHFLLLLRSCYLIIPYVLSLVFFTAYLVRTYVIESADIFLFYLMEMRFIYILLGVFIFLGYEFAIKAQDAGLRERAETLPGGIFKNFIAQTAVLAAAAGGVFLISLLFVAFPVIAQGIGYWPFILHLLKLSFLYVFCASLISAMLGAALATLKCKRFLAYALALLWLLNNTSFLESFLHIPDSLLGWSPGTHILYAIKDFFTVVPTGLEYYPDYMYGIGMEAPKWFIACFWLGFAVLIPYLKLQRRNLNKLLAGGLTVFCALCLWGYGNKANIVTLDYRINGEFSHDHNYYYVRKDNPKDTSPPGFMIESYDMELRAGNKLRARVKMGLSDLAGGKDEYRFTLYHGYEVSRVEDGRGGRVSFAQYEDTVTVAASELNGNEITLIYSGYSPRYYSNTQGIALPGYFPYYPMEGDKRVDGDSGSNMDKEIARTEKDFRVKIITPNRVACNLDGGDNSFYGRARSLTLLAGMIEPLEEGNGGYWLPMRDKPDWTQLDLFEDQLVYLRTILGDDLPDYDISDYEVWIVPNVFARSGDDYSTILDGYMLTEYFEAEDVIYDLLNNIITRKSGRSNIKSMFIYYFTYNITSMYPGYAKAPEQHVNALRYLDSLTGNERGYAMMTREAFNDAFTYLTQQPGAEEMLRRVYEYLQSDSTLDEVQFLITLFERGDE